MTAPKLTDEELAPLRAGGLVAHDIVDRLLDEHAEQKAEIALLRSLVPRAALAEHDARRG